METKAQETDAGAELEIDVTNCPECGTEWEVVVTKRTPAAKPGAHREE